MPALFLQVRSIFAGAPIASAVNAPLNYWLAFHLIVEGYKEGS